MKVMHVIHGYPPHYMAGSEVYTYNLTRELVRTDEITVFTRIENPFESSYAIFDEEVDGMKIRRVNKPQRDYTLDDKYLDVSIDDAFRAFVDEIEPDLVHVGHLSHLSTNIINIAKEEFGLPILYTIHDFWLFCYRGQMINTSSEVCSSPGNGNCYICARDTFKHGVSKRKVSEYRRHMMRVIDNVDTFLSPSRFLLDFFQMNGVPDSKLVYSKYGFDRTTIHFKMRHYSKDSNVSFGFLGRVIPVKGIKLLLEAFGTVCSENAELLIFGDAGSFERYLGRYANDRVCFEGPFKNWEIGNILDRIDVLVAPSLWYENSPLVIQEAFLAGIPVITSDLGGMSELVDDGVDGFLFEVGNMKALADIMKKFVGDPTILNKLTPSPDKVRSIEDDAGALRKIYRVAVKR